MSSLATSTQVLQQNVLGLDDSTCVFAPTPFHCDPPNPFPFGGLPLFVLRCKHSSTAEIRCASLTCSGLVISLLQLASHPSVGSSPSLFGLSLSTRCVSAAWQCRSAIRRSTSSTRLWISSMPPSRSLTLPSPCARPGAVNAVIRARAERKGPERGLMLMLYQENGGGFNHSTSKHTHSTQHPELWNWLFSPHHT